MDNNQNGDVDRLMWPFRPVARLIAIDVVQFGTRNSSFNWCTDRGMD
jgi:hypothetical protein